MYAFLSAYLLVPFVFITFFNLADMIRKHRLRMLVLLAILVFWFLYVIGVGGDWRATKERIGQWQIPYGVLVPEKIDNVLAAGRCVSGHSRLADYLRVIPTCFVTGHAAGCAAALAVQDRCRPRDVDVPKLQKVLREQDAYLG